MTALFDDAATFGREHFGEADLGDQRRTKRLVGLADQMFKHPGGTLPDKLRDPAGLKALYRLMDTDTVTHESILAPHRRRTLAKLEQLQAAGQVTLIIHDWTELDFTSKFSLDGLGQIGNGDYRGYICHNSLAVLAGSREVIGLANQILHHRPVKKSQKTKRTAAQRRDDEQRESRVWVKAIDQIDQTRKSMALAPGDGPGLIVDVCDRGADTFEFLERQAKRGQRFVVRSTQKRRLMTDNGPPQFLHAFARQLPSMGHKPLSLSANLVRKARDTSVQIAAAPVKLRAPRSKRGEHSSAPLSLWIVRVWEPDPPEGEKPVEWFLLTNHPAEVFEAACDVTEWYSCRPVIEEFHKGQKTGCSIQQMQFNTQDRLQPAIALLSVISLTLLSLRDASRRPDAKTRKATELLSRDYVEVLSLWRYKKVDPDMSLHDFYYALARLGGHQNRKNDHRPGWLVLWRGWEQLQAMDLGADAERMRKRYG